MEREGVVLADRDALLSGDLEEIRTRIRNDYSEPHEARVIIEPEPPTIMEPEPEPEPPTIMEPEPEPPVIMDPEEPEPKAKTKR